MPHRAMAVLGLCALLSGGAAQAQWQAIPLHPSGFSRSQAMAVSAGGQGGYAFGSAYTPILWNGSTSGYTNLLPAGATTGYVGGMNGQYQVGYASFQGEFHAALWSGTAASFVDLHPAGALGSEANAIVGGQQVGAAYIGTLSSRAALWSGSASSFVDLHPTGAIWSTALATDGVNQGGRVALPVPPPQGSTLHAALWSGTASSFVDLNPAGARESIVYGMAPGVQVGYAYLSGFSNPHAALWLGTASSFMDLNPPGAGRSELNGTNGTIHVGAAWFGALSSATVWLDSTPNNIVNLHSLLPPGYALSRATGIYEDKGQIYISGFALVAGGSYEAFLWTNVPSPGAATILLIGLVRLARRRR